MTRACRKPLPAVQFVHHARALRLVGWMAGVKHVDVETARNLVMRGLLTADHELYFRGAGPGLTLRAFLGRDRYDEVAEAVRTKRNGE